MIKAWVSSSFGAEYLSVFEFVRYFELSLWDSPAWRALSYKDLFRFYVCCEAALNKWPNGDLTLALL